MKTEKQLQTEIAAQKKAVEKAREAQRKAASHKGSAVWRAASIERKKAESRLKFLEDIVPYVRSRPRLEFLQTQKERLSNSISRIEAEYIAENPKNNDPKHRQRYEKEHNIPAMKRQLNTLIYLTT